MKEEVYLGRKFYRQMFFIMLLAPVISLGLWLDPDAAMLIMAVSVLLFFFGFMIYVFWLGWIAKPPPENSG